MEKKMETTIMGYIGTTLRIHSRKYCSQTWDHAAGVYYAVVMP